MSLKKEHIASLALLIFYTVGIVGLLLEEYRELFLSLTPFNLLLTLGLFSWANQDFSKRFGLSFLVVFLIGFGVEVVGVATGSLFGSYYYGDSLGIKFLDVPLIIGVNWFLLAYSTKGISDKLSENIFVKSLIASALMVGLDVLIEPVAIQLDFWHWENDIIPLQNFVMWFVTAFVIQLILNKLANRINIFIAISVYIVQVLFFGLLNLML